MRWTMMAVLTALAAASPALAHPGKHHGWHGGPPWHGPGWDKREWRHAYRGGDCRVERKWSRNGDYKEEIKCDGPPWARGYIVPPPAYNRVWVAPPRPLPPLPRGPAYGEVFRDDRGVFCREYQTTGVIDGRRERLYGTACLQPDGSWAFDD